MAKKYVVVDKGDAIEINELRGKGVFGLIARYEKDNKGFVPSIIMNKLHDLHVEGYTEAV